MQDIILTVGCALLVTWVPGIVVLLAARVGWLYTLAAAPAATYAAVYVGTLAADLLGGTWNLGWLIGAAVMLGLITWTIAHFLRASPAPTGSRWRWTHWAFISILFATAVALGATAYARVSLGLTVIPQDYDHVFLANAIRFIADTGIATPEGLVGVNTYLSDYPFYYPASFHALAALTVQLTGTGVVLALHAHVILWFLAIPLGTLAMARSFGFGWVGAGVAALVSTSFTSFPYEPIWRGLVPFTQSLIMILPVVALVMLGVRRRSGADAWIIALCALGVVSTHTSGAVTLVVLAAPLLITAVWVFRRELRATLIWMGATAGVLLVLLVPTILAMSQIIGDAVHDWAAIRTLRDGVSTALLFGTGYRSDTQVELAVLVWLGVLCAVIVRRYRRTIPLVVSMLAAMGLYVLAVAIDSPLSMALTRWWWNDQLRLAAIAAMMAPVFVGVLGDSIAGVCRSFWSRSGVGDRVVRIGLRRGGVVFAFCALFGILVSGVYLAATDRGYYQRNHDAMLFRYALGDTVTPAEADGFRTLATLVPDDQRVMNDFRDGSAWMYALEGVRPVFGHFAVDRNMPEQAVLDARFDEIASDPEVRAIVDELNIEFVWLSEGFVTPGWTRSPGLDDLAAQPDVFHLVYENSGAQIYRIDPSVLNGS